MLLQVAHVGFVLLGSLSLGLGMMERAGIGSDPSVGMWASPLGRGIWDFLEFLSPGAFNSGLSTWGKIPKHNQWLCNPWGHISSWFQQQNLMERSPRLDFGCGVLSQPAGIRESWEWVKKVGKASFIQKMGTAGITSAPSAAVQRRAHFPQKKNGIKEWKNGEVFPECDVGLGYWSQGFLLPDLFIPAPQMLPPKLAKDSSHSYF